MTKESCENVYWESWNIEWRKEIWDYEAAQKNFYNDPLHWSNNKRRRHGLPALRGNINQERSKHFRSFRPSVRLFNLIADATSEQISTNLQGSEYYCKFVEAKEVAKGDFPYNYYFKIE